MSRIGQFRLHLVMVGVLLCQSCATIQQNNVKSDPQERIQSLNARLRSNQKDQAALRELGVVYFDLQQYTSARKFLIKAFKLKPDDPQTLLYLGMALETEKKEKIALKVYKQYTKVPVFSSYRKLLKGKYQLLSRKLIREEMQSLARHEGQTGVEQLSPDAVAVFPLNYQGNDPQYAVLGKGISEMMITDLSQVPNLKLIERVRLQALIDEIGLGQSGMVEESTAPRFGKLLRAGKIIHGTYDVKDKRQLQMNMAYWDVVNQASPNLMNKNDALSNLFDLEKDLVFRVVDDMGIQLTPADREKIQRIPTKNMQAFMSYCMGLDREDANDFQGAAQCYEKALQLDPSFTRAGEKAEMSKDISLGEKSSGSMAAATDNKIDRPGSPVANSNLINDRLQNLTSSIGSNFIPGQDNRKSMEEAATSGAAFYGDLPKPPPLPQKP